MAVRTNGFRWVCGIAVFAALLAPARADFSKDEINMGKEAAKEVEKETKVVTDAAINKRVNDIGQALARVSEEPKAEFTFKVLDDKEVNAFALPGGFVYVYKGLLNEVQSDDELAGVLAHEITHATHHHTEKILKKQRPWDMATMAVLLAGVLSGKDISGVAQGVNIANMAKINGYTVDLEKDADDGGMKTMLKSKFNPVGMLTFMERLAYKETHSGSAQVQLGIFRTHPYSLDRANALRADLERANVPIIRRLVTNSLRVSADSVKVNDQDAATVKMDNKTIVTLTGDGHASALDRAKAVAQVMNDLLDKDLRRFEVKVGDAGSDVVARDATVVRVTDADARLAGLPASAVAKNAVDGIRTALLSDYLRSNS
ncbi:MAG TPA: M48 family metalloprotease [Armatimonadota bacterium]|jgi:predicted Zn-dependent protease